MGKAVACAVIDDGVHREPSSSENFFKRNPVLVVEVLSNSTAAFDRGAKFAHYRQLDSLREYVPIEPERRSIDLFRRNANGNRVLHPITDGGQLELASLDFQCPLESVYEDVELD